MTEAKRGPVRDRQRAAKPFSRWAIDLRPLRAPAYRRMWLGNAVSMYGYQFTAVAVPFQMYTLTKDSFWVGLLGVAGLVPLLVFGLWGGAAADAVDRRRLLLSSSALAWLTTLGLLAQALFQVGSPVLLLVLVAVQSAAFAVSSPTRNAIVPRLVPAELVPAANTLNFTTFQLSLVFGPLTAGLVFAAWGPGFALPVAYVLDALLFTVSLWATVRLPAVPPVLAEPGPPTDSAGQSDAPAAPSVRRVGPLGLRSVIDGIRYLATTPVLLLSFAVDLIAMVLAMPRALFPEVAAERLAGGAALGWLFGALGIGGLIGGLTSGWIGRVRRQGVALVVAVVGWGLAVAGAGLARQLWLVVGLLALAGAADLISSVFRQSILQIYAPDRMRGRLQGVYTVVVAGGPRFGDLRAGATAAAFGVSFSWVGGGIAAALLTLALAFTFPALLRYRPATKTAGS
ncbi:MAG TPA: MFS transporter [Micromonosporaceae bacterium]|nr:MFS transporter [Micromonosporaceae bacterium]